MNEVSYFTMRARHYRQLAAEVGEPRLKEAYEAVAADMSARAAIGDPNREFHLIDGLAAEGWCRMVGWTRPGKDGESGGAKPH
jgi:hypothetical protein